MEALVADDEMRKSLSSPFLALPRPLRRPNLPLLPAYIHRKSKHTTHLQRYSLSISSYLLLGLFLTAFPGRATKLYVLLDFPPGRLWSGFKSGDNLLSERIEGDDLGSLGESGGCPISFMSGEDKAVCGQNEHICAFYNKGPRTRINPHTCIC